MNKKVLAGIPLVLPHLFGISLSAQTRPNIIFIMTDDQSPIPIEAAISTESRPFGFNGDRYVHTPVIDSLAQNGIVFSRAYVPSSVSSASRYSILTGRYPSRCESDFFMAQNPAGEMSRPENNVELEEATQNLPRLLKNAGYRTGFVGKSHLVDQALLNASATGLGGYKTYSQGDDPNLPEVSEKMAYNHDLWVKRVKEFGFDYANAVYSANLKELNNDSLNVHNVEWKNKAALEFIEQSGDEPFFLYYSENIPHGPAPWTKRDGKYPYGLDANPKFTSKGLVEADYSYLPGRDEIKSEVQSLGLDERHAWLTWFDYAVGAIVDKLRDKGVLENTLIIITSDHGNYNTEKATLYEGGVRVPLMMFWPAGIEAGLTYDELVQSIDFPATFLELAGVDLDDIDPIDGISLKSVLAGSKEPVHDHLYFEIGYARGVMTKNWKYVAVRYDEETERGIEAGVKFPGFQGELLDAPYYTRNKDLGYRAAAKNPLYFERNQLFNLVNDPDELVNLYNSKPDTALSLVKNLREILKSFPERPYGEFTRSATTVLKEKFPDNDLKIQIYPNPSKGCFNIKLPESLQNGVYKVYDLSGSLINYGSFCSDQFELDLLNASSGFYYLVVSDAMISLSETLVIV
ncbi:MAG: sulfatase-like hydrolase/transferase [Bacteroidales bacterium]|nr:sulfatase-like hydrolase/transferase [Bacteroidales bacterium]